jgi:hypothetical protein
VGDGAFTEIRYEDLAADPAQTLRQVAAFLGIANGEDLMAVLAPRLRCQVRAESVGKWKQGLSWREIECFEAFAGDELRTLGYPLQFRPRAGRRSMAEAAVWKAQAVCRRLANRRYWADNWYKLGLRLQDAALPLRTVLRARQRQPWIARGVRP